MGDPKYVRDAFCEDEPQNGFMGVCSWNASGVMRGEKLTLSAFGDGNLFKGGININEPRVEAIVKVLREASSGLTTARRLADAASLPLPYRPIQDYLIYTRNRG